MPALAPPVTDERDALVAFLDYHQSAFPAVAHGLTDEQARATPTVSALSVGGLIKHATGVQRSWMARVAAAPGSPAPDERPMEVRQAEYRDEYLMTPDETLTVLLERLAAQNAETLRLARTADLDAAVPVPRDAPWFPRDVDAWSVRWVFLHVANELARHAGHADILRESLDGATMYELIAALENWGPQPWLTPWKAGQTPGGTHRDHM
ncbi:DinB family protein [Mycolicibacterium palauense]|uniref:DinB family protein n=1 Tax=Mycolicibacterium palauense TaxID=2034511 RepID=UPI000BFEF935|nr:DinB family protein [Mycolicibacterium palauense]